MFSKWNRFFWKVLPASFFIALIVTGVYTVTKLEFSNNLYLTFEMSQSAVSPVKLYFDMGKGFNEKTAIVGKAGKPGEFHTFRFPIPEGEIKRIRLDPFSKRPGQFAIRSMKVVDRFENVIGIIPLDAFIKVKEMETYHQHQDHWVGITTSDARDSQIMIANEKKLEKPLDYPIRTKIQHVLAAHYQLLLRIFGTVGLLSLLLLVLKQKEHQG